MKWYSHPETGVRHQNLFGPSRLLFGSDLRDGTTTEFAKDIDVIINVSDTSGVIFDLLSHQKAYWFPLNELGYWGYSPLFGIIRCIEAHQDKTIYLHCHAGAYRAPVVAAVWLLYNKLNQEEIRERTGVRLNRIPNLPEIQKLEIFLSRMREKPSHSLMSILLHPAPFDYSQDVFYDRQKAERIKNIYETPEMA